MAISINLEQFVGKEVTVTLRNYQTLTGTIESSLGKASPLNCSRYPYFMNSDLNCPLIWKNNGRWDIVESEYDIMSIVENTEQQLLKSIQETERQLEKLKEQLKAQKAPTIQNARVGDTLEDGSIVLKKGGGLALVVAPMATEVSCPWSKEFSEVFDRLASQGFIPSQWFVPTVEHLRLAYGAIPSEFSKEIYWSSSDFNASSAYLVFFVDGDQWMNTKSDFGKVRAFRCVCY
jgi:hypothetical protein